MSNEDLTFHDLFIQVEKLSNEIDKIGRSLQKIDEEIRTLKGLRKESIFISEPDEFLGRFVYFNGKREGIIGPIIGEKEYGFYVFIDEDTMMKGDNLTNLILRDANLEKLIDRTRQFFAERY